MKRVPTIIFLGDGMADEPVAGIGNRTPLQAARTPAMDSIARDGRSGTLLTLPQGFPTSSEVANMSVLGCDLPTEYCGRGPLEAIGRGIPLKPSDVVFRMNLTTQDNGVLRDFSGGHISQKNAESLIACLNDEFGSSEVRFHPGVSYRNLLVLSGKGFSSRVKTDKPDDNHGEIVANHLPSALHKSADKTVKLLRRLISDAPRVLEAHPVNRSLMVNGHATANGVWPWSGGSAGALKTIREKYGITGAVISAVDVIVGLGKCLGMDAIMVPGATGYIDTNYEGKADAAIEALKKYDLVFLHVEAIDEVSHAKDLKLKIQAIEDFDSRVIARVLAKAGDVNAVILADHPVPVMMGKHTRTPVPVAVRMKDIPPDGVMTYDELVCKSGALGAMSGPALMNLLFANPA